MRRFQLRRLDDVNGVSGTGVVVQGVQFDDGACAIRWVSDYPSTTHHDSIENVIAVHGHGGRTVIEWLDPGHPAVIIPAKLGWSNPDTGPEQMRLYALDAGDQPRWAKPHARTVETAIRDTEYWREGTRAVVVITGSRTATADTHRVSCPQHGDRVMDLAGPEPMCEDCRVVGADGRPLGWQDGRPTDLAPLCRRGARHGEQWYACDLPADHLDEPRNDDRHQQAGGPTWRYVDGRAEFD